MAIKFFSGIDLSNVTAGSILKVDSNGVIVAAVDGTDYNTSSGSWTDAGSDIYRNSDVRIGTYQASVNPAARLHVFDYQSTDVKLLLEDGNTGDASMQFKVSAQSYVMGLDNSDSDRFKLSAGTAFGSTGLTMKSTGQLGINGVPSGDLDVISAATPTLFVRTSAVSSQDAIVRIQGSRTTSTTSEIAQLRFETVDSDSSGTELARISALKDTASTNVGRLEFYTMPTNGGTLASRMTIKGDGKVGIGTNTPAGQFQSYISSTRYFGHNVNSGDLSVVSDNSSSPVFKIQGTGTADLINVLDNTTNVFTVKDGGDTGIGTSSPDTRLHLYEAAASPVLLTLHNYQSDINPNGTQGNFIDFKMTDDNVTFTPQARIGMLVKDSDGDSGLGSEGCGHFVVYTGETTNADGTGALTERLRVTEKGNVGIGTNDPSYKLHVSGNVGITEYLQHSGDNNTYLRFTTDLIRLAAGGVEMIRLLEDATQDAVIINEGGADVDFRVESDTDTHAFFIQASDGNVGIGTSTPAATLHVDGSVRFEDLTSGILKVDADGDLSVDTNTYLSTTDAASTYATTDHVHSDATTSASGFMSSTDKTKLDGIASNATANAGTVTTVTVGTGLDVSNGGTTPNITLDLSELTDMTASVNTSQDELILLDNGAERRKMFNEIFGSAAYSNTSAFATASHNHDSVYSAKTDSYISLFSDSWGNTPEGKYIRIDFPYRSGSGSSAYYVFDVFGFRDIGQMDSMVNYRVYAHTRSNGTETNDVKFRVYKLHDQQGEFFEFAYKTQTGSATQFFIYIEEDYSGAEIFGLPLDQGEFAKLTSSMISSSDTAPSGTTQVTAEVAHPTINTTAGTYGSTANGTKIDEITIDANGHITNISTGATGNMTGFFVEDGDGTEVQITNAKEWKFVEGTGIDINWTDTDNGNDADPYDLTFGIKNNSIGIDQLNVSDGTNGQVLTTNGSGTLSFSTVLTSVAFSDLTSTPTTVSGYGITDAVSSSDVAFSLSGDDITIGDSLTLAGGLTYTDSTSTLSLSLTTPVSGDWWNGGYTKVGTDGVMEVGKYIDWHDSDTETDDFSYRMTANSGRMYFSGDIEVDGGDIYITDGNTRLHEGNGNALRVTTDSGYIEIGAMNTSHCHIQTDRSNFYFSTEIRVDSGIIGSYNEDLLLRRAGTTKITCAASTTTIEDNTVINGTLEATAKSFNIEHPTKEGKRLVYGSLEGAEHGVYFRGKGTGEVIKLPDHWTGLVHEDSITVQLTPIGKNCVWVEDIKDNSVHVGMDNDTPYFYFIQAERKDIDKLIVEQDA